MRTARLLIREPNGWATLNLIRCHDDEIADACGHLIELRDRWLTSGYLPADAELTIRAGWVS